MAVTITCRCCNAVYKVGDDKRGLVVRCAKCQEEMPVPKVEHGVQSGSRVKIKAAPSHHDGDDERRPSARPAQGGSSMALLVLGGLALLFVFLCGGGGIGAYLMFRTKPSGPAENPEPQAKLDIKPAIDNEGKKQDEEKTKKKEDDKTKKEEEKTKKDDDRVKKEDPPKIDPIVLKPLPADLAPELEPRIKQATVYLKTALPGGDTTEGSGFFAFEPGIIITNMHVLGLTRGKGPAPKTVQVVLNRGEINEKQVTGDVLGGDPLSQLAVVRVSEGNLPIPLVLETKYELSAAQKVYLAGSPNEAAPNKKITIVNSTVSGFDKATETQEIMHVRINSGLHAGNSGGPIVNTLGNIVGVCVAGAKGSASFAVPAEKVKFIMEGRIADSKFGEAYIQDVQTNLPVTFTCLDPLKRIREMRVEVWTGSPGPARPYSMQKPQGQFNDGPRKQYPVPYQNGTGSLDVPLPKADLGDVYWVQPIIITRTGITHWGTAQPTSSNMLVIERRSANLKVSLTAQKERTVTLKGAQSETYIKGKVKEISLDKIETTMLEVLARDPKGAGVSSGFGAFKKTAEEDGKPAPVNDQVDGLMRKRAPFFIIDNANKIQSRTDPKVTDKLEPGLRQEVDSAYGLLCSSIETVTLPMPNRVVEPKEQWNVDIPLTLRPGKKPLVVDLALVCTYEGIRVRDLRQEAVITIAGKVKGRGEPANKVGGGITGKIAFDMAGGYITQAQLSISAEIEFPAEEKQMISAFDIAVNRQPGNPQSIAKPPEYKAAGLAPDAEDPFGPIMGKGAILMNVKGMLRPTDPIDPFFRFQGSRMNLRTIKLTAGKTYVISLNSAAFDAYLRLQNPKGITIAQDDDSGGGLNARIVFTCTQSGTYGVVATSFNGQMGPYQLIIQEGAPVGKMKGPFGP